jgi:hypothetical protein
MVACKFHRYPARHIALMQATMNTHLYLSLLRPAAGVFQVSIGWASACKKKTFAVPQAGASQLAESLKLLLQLQRVNYRARW